jgi:hypothetical protein
MPTPEQAITQLESTVARPRSCRWQEALVATVRVAVVDKTLFTRSPRPAEVTGSPARCASAPGFGGRLRATLIVSTTTR